MSVNKRIASLIVAGGLVMGSVPYNVFADSVNTVTIGANLSEVQRAKVMEFFGTSEDKVDVIEVTNDDERKYLGGIASEEQIGKKTFSCSYVEPTTDGGINVKTANLTYVTSSMIASTLMTSGVENANVLATSPIEVSGTGALTGVMMAYEQSSGEELDEEKKEIASEELVTTGDLSDEVGQDKATGIINDIKTEIIKNNTQDTTQIAETITNVTNNYNVTLNVGQIEAIQGLMEKISKQGYDYNAIKGTLDIVTENVDKGLESVGEEIKRGSFFENMMNSVKDFFGGIFSGGAKEENKDLGILEGTNDGALGEDVQIDATDDRVVDVEELKEEAKGFFAKIVDWFKGLFGGNDEAPKEDIEVEVPPTVEDEVVGEDNLDLGIEDNKEDDVVTDETDENAPLEGGDSPVSNENDVEGNEGATNGSEGGTDGGAEEPANGGEVEVPSNDGEDVVVN